MQKIFSIPFFSFLLLSFCTEIFAQDSAAALMQRMEIKSTSPKDSVITKASFSDTVKKFDPRKATIRSAIIPGWGQAYNKKYWKIPIVYGALGTTAGIFFYNVHTYNQLRQAFTILYSGDTADYNKIDPKFRGLSTDALRSYRDTFRQNIDYSVLFFLIFWGLNVVDATVDAHLKGFDVGNNLSLQLKPGYSPLANTSGISLVLNFDRRHM